MDVDLLKQFVFWLMFSGGGGIVVYALIDRIPQLSALAPRRKRYAALGLSAALPILAWLVAIGMGYHPQPSTWQSWIEQAVALIGASFSLSQIIHARQL